MLLILPPHLCTNQHLPWTSIGFRAFHILIHCASRTDRYAKFIKQRNSKVVPSSKHLPNGHFILQTHYWYTHIWALQVCLQYTLELLDIYSTTVQNFITNPFIILGLSELAFKPKSQITIIKQHETPVAPEHIANCAEPSLISLTGVWAQAINVVTGTEDRKYSALN